MSEKPKSVTKPTASSEPVEKVADPVVQPLHIPLGDIGLHPHMGEWEFIYSCGGCGVSERVVAVSYWPRICARCERYMHMTRNPI